MKKRRIKGSSNMVRINGTLSEITRTGRMRTGSFQYRFVRTVNRERRILFAQRFSNNSLTISFTASTAT